MAFGTAVPKCFIEMLFSLQLRTIGMCALALFLLLLLLR